MSVDVVIVTFNSAATVGQALSSCRSCNDIASLVVVDNDSRDGSAELAQAAGADRVVRNPENKGFAAAVNRGLRAGTADLVLLLNPDAEIAAPALSALCDVLAVAPRAVMAGPVLTAPSVDGGAAVTAAGQVEVGARRFSTVANRVLWWLPLPSLLRPAWATPEYRHRASLLATPRPVPVDYLWGAALLVRRSFLDEIGGLDERFFLYSEDEDLGRAARARQREVLLVPQARVTHIGGVSSGDQAWARARIQAANRLLFEKWDGRSAARTFWAAIGPVLCVRAAVLGLAGRRVASVEAARMRHFLRVARAEMDAHAARR